MSYYIHMKLISFDVGIKNMAYCIFSVSPEKLITIISWDVLNLMDEQPTVEKCDCVNVLKKKNSTPKPCVKLAKYQKTGKKYCEKHAKECSQYMIPKKEFSTASLKKMNIKRLSEVASELGVEFPTGLQKTKMVETLENFLKPKLLELLVEQKGKSAKDMDLIQIGRNMKQKLDGIGEDVTHVIIENQISPIANRMKTIQGMLAQYFIMVNPNTHIEFVSSVNKLKEFENPGSNGSDYKTHKKDAVHYCSLFIEKNAQLRGWKITLDTKKKDDLADCFLQGVWYLKNKENVTLSI